MRKTATTVALGLVTLATSAMAINAPMTLEDLTPANGDGGVRTNDCPAPVVFDTGMFDEFTPPSGCSSAGSAGCFVNGENPEGAPVDWRRIADDFSTAGETITHVKFWGRYNQWGYDSGRRVDGFCIRIHEVSGDVYCPDGTVPGLDAIGTVVYDQYVGAGQFTEQELFTGLTRNFNYCLTLPVPFPTTAGTTYWLSVSGDYDLVLDPGGTLLTQWFVRLVPGGGFTACEVSGYFCDDVDVCDPWTDVSTLFALPCWEGWDLGFVLYGDPAATGACCSTSGVCQVTTAAECTAPNQYQGDGTTCDPNPCPQPTLGACCFGIDCIVVTPGECSNLGGEYKGDGTVCDPNPCLPIATEKKTWGGVKKAYGN